MGFPIRTSAARCLVDGSPQLFAVTHVLHRFLAPRHPPLALCSLERTKFHVQRTRCSCLLCSSQGAIGACGALAVRRARRSGATSPNSWLPEGGRIAPTPSKRKRRQMRRRHRRGRTNPTTLTVASTNPPVHQLGVQTSGDHVITDDVEWTP